MGILFVEPYIWLFWCFGAFSFDGHIVIIIEIKIYYKRDLAKMDSSTQLQHKAQDNIQVQS